jgi:hypothetical protein
MHAPTICDSTAGETAAKVVDGRATVGCLRCVGDGQLQAPPPAGLRGRAGARLISIERLVNNTTVRMQPEMTYGNGLGDHDGALGSEALAVHFDSDR